MESSNFSFAKYISELISKYSIQILIALGIFTYFNSLYNGFVWTDTSEIIPRVFPQGFDLIRQFLSNGAFNDGGRYVPFTGIYAVITYTLFTDNAFFYHLLQLGLHLTNSILLFFIFRKFFGKNLSLFLTSIFVVHPVNAESVAFVGAFNGPLFFFFGVLALFLSFEEKISYKRLILISLLLFASMTTRENGAVFLFLILLYQLFFKRKHLLPFFLLEIVLVLSYVILRLVTVGFNFQKFHQVPIAFLSLSERIANIPAEISYYLKNFVYPVNLAVNQRWVIEKINFQGFYLPLIVEISILFLLIGLSIYFWLKVRKYFYILAFFFLWFISGIALYLNIIPLDMTVADRWMYFPMVGILGVIGVLINEAKIKNENLKTLAILVASLIIVLLSFRTIIRNTNFSDDITLFEHDSKVSTNFHTENYLGTVFQNKQKYDQALIHYKKSIQLAPNATALYNIGSLYASLQDYEKAEEYYSQLINMSNFHSLPKHFVLQTYADFAIVEYLLNKQQEALRAAEETVKIEPKQSTRELYRLILNREHINFSMFKPI